MVAEEEGGKNYPTDPESLFTIPTLQLGLRVPSSLKRARPNLGFIRLKSLWFPGRPPTPTPIKSEAGKSPGCSPTVGLCFAPGGGAESFRAS